MQTQPKKVILQQDVSLSKCDIWRLQKNFFAHQGINAWAGQVPFYITSNPYIANSYAQVILRFMQDCIRQRRYSPLEPFYIMELATGSGTFSFYLIKQLLALRKIMDLEHVPFVYVMTDFTLNNIQYWQQHPALQEYLAQGILDFAQYDMETMQPIQLQRSNITLRHGSEPLNPLIVIANYAFDTVTHDVFKIKDSQLSEGLVTLSTTEEIVQQSQPIGLHNVTTELSYRSINRDYYADPNLNAVLHYYSKHYDNINLLLPIGSLRCIQNLQRLSNDNILLLATDKGYSNYLADYSMEDPAIAWHGSVSFMVNFHAMGQYFKQCGGDVYYQTVQQDIVSCAFVLGQSFKNLTETQLALTSYFDQFGPGNLFNIYRYIETTKQQCDLATLLTHLNTTLWDPQVFDQFLPYILELLDRSNPITIQDLLAVLPKVAANFYYMPAGINTLTNIGFLLQQVGQYSEALKYFQRALSYASKHGGTYYNMGLCYYQQQDYKQALSMFEQAVQWEPDNILVNGWLLKIQTELQEHKVVGEINKEVK